MKRPDGHWWYLAGAEEINSQLENGTWQLVELPPGAKAIGLRWVFKVKRKADGSVDRYKGRLVAQGFGQRPGQDFNEVFMPTTKWAALRSLIALATMENLEMVSVDISTAYLNGKLEETV